MSTDTTQALIERFVKFNPETDRIVQGDGTHFGNSEVDRAAVSGEYCDVTIDRLERHNRSLDTRNRELEQELRQNDRDFTGLALEYQDLADENRRLKQELEIKTVVADARDNTIRELRAELNTARSMSLAGSV